VYMNIAHQDDLKKYACVPHNTNAKVKLICTVARRARARRYAPKVLQRVVSSIGTAAAPIV